MGTKTCSFSSRKQDFLWAELQHSSSDCNTNSCAISGLTSREKQVISGAAGVVSVLPAHSTEQRAQALPLQSCWKHSYIQSDSKLLHFIPSVGDCKTGFEEWPLKPKILALRKPLLKHVASCGTREWYFYCATAVNPLLALVFHQRAQSVLCLLKIWTVVLAPLSVLQHCPEHHKINEFIQRLNICTEKRLKEKAMQPRGCATLTDIKSV